MSPTILQTRGILPAGTKNGPAYGRVAHYRFKQADTPGEFDQIHRLNFDTFVREVPQHDISAGDSLVDKFHEKNVYLIALHDDEVVGMLAAHDRPPFSTASRLADPGLIARLGGRPLEVRLLAIKPGVRHGRVFAGLGWLLCEHALRHGHSHLLISGLSDRLRFYERLGFRALGPAVRSGQAYFVPMVMPVVAMPSHVRRDFERMRNRLRRRTVARRRESVSFLPGPVQLSQPVRKAMAAAPISHRSTEFVETYEQVRTILKQIVGGPDVALLTGSGTLANDAVAAALAADPSAKRGLVLVNGEFGRRLIAQARRAGLCFDTLQWPWGKPWCLDTIEQALDADSRPDWVWAVHLETSTGVLNDAAELQRLCRRRSIRVCLDCISSVGAVPVNLRSAYLATGVSGKSLGGVAGLAFVFASTDALSSVDWDCVPNSLDVKRAIECRGSRFTCPSPQLHALRAALVEYETAPRRDARFAHYDRLGRYIRRDLESMGLSVLAREAEAAPVITSISSGCAENAERLLAGCRAAGFELHGGSGYLRERGLVQIATMGAVTLEHCRRLCRTLRQVVAG